MLGHMPVTDLLDRTLSTVAASHVSNFPEHMTLRCSVYSHPTVQCIAAVLSYAASPHMMLLRDLTLLLTVLPTGCIRIAAGGGFGGAPIRSRLVGDGNLPDDPPVVLAPQRGPPPDAAARTNNWRPGAEGTTPPDRWNGAAPLVSDSTQPTPADTTAAHLAC